MNKLSGMGLALFAILAGNIAAPLGRGAILLGMNPTTLLLVRLGLATLLLAITVVTTAPQRLRIDAKGALWIGVIGVMSGIEICCFFWSLTWLDASIATMIASTQPVVVLIMLALGGERLSQRQIARLLLALAGVYLLIGPGGHVHPMGLLLLAVSVMLYSAQLVLSQWYLRAYDFRTVTLYLIGVMTLVIAGLWWVEGAEWHAPDPRVWLLVAVLAVVSTYLARLALYAGIQRVGSGQIALFIPLGTLTAVIGAVLFLHERLTPLQWLGASLILISAMLAAKRLHFGLRPAVPSQEQI